MSKIIESVQGVKKRSKGLYWALIATFVALYVAVAFVSTLHAITFFKITNALGLAILLGAAYEVGQATVLFSILMTENKNRILAWLMMFLLTALQITANVYASFKFMDTSGSTDWTFWQRSILFNVQAIDSEMYKVIISWISGALLPLVALGMTALVADNIRLMRGEHLGRHKEEETPTEDQLEEIIENEVQKRLLEVEKDEDDIEVDEAFELIKDESPTIEDVAEAEEDAYDTYLLDIQDQMEKPKVEADDAPDFPWEKEDATEEDIQELKDIASEVKAPEFKPVNKMRGWHLMKEYVDDDHNVFSKGEFIEHNPDKTPTSKKA